MLTCCRHCLTQLGYRALPDALRNRVETLRGHFRPGRTHEVPDVQVTKPCVLTNPTNGTKTLYVTGGMRFEGMDSEEGKELKEEILSYIMREEHIYSHSWRMGDMLIYDNAQLLHKRDAFEGIRFLKATRVFLDPNRFSVPIHDEKSI